MKTTSVLAFAASLVLNANGLQKENTLCFTQWASNQPASCPTAWETHYTPCTVTSTRIWKTWGPPQVATSTSTVYVTKTETGSATSQTAVRTTTSTVTSVTKSTTTFITTNTTTLYQTSTTTVAAPSGFLGIQQSLQGTTWDGEGGPDPIAAKREAIFEARTVNTSNLFAHPAFPKIVNCQKWSPSSQCTTVSTTQTSTAQPSKPTATKTVTSIVTSTIVPAPKTTVTSTFTTTFTSTSIYNATSTATATATSTSTSSLYQACAPSNLADFYNGLGIENAIGSNAFAGVNTISGPKTAYECCVAAIYNNPNATITSAFAWQLNAVPNVCLVAVQNSPCTAGQNTTDIIALVGNEQYFVLGNARCGKVDQVMVNDSGV